MSDTTLQPVVVTWPSTKTNEFGDIQSFRAEIDADVKGRLDIYKVPTNEAYPNGYWAGICTGSSREFVEPGCASYEKKLICQIRLNGLSEDDKTISIRTDIVEYIHPEIPLDYSLINNNPSDKGNE